MPKDKSPNLLQVPDIVAEDPDAVEIFRLFHTPTSEGRDHVCTIQMLPEWGDPALWGIAIADMIRHIARFYVQSGAHIEYEDGTKKMLTEEHVFDRLMPFLIKELEHPTGAVTKSQVLQVLVHDAASRVVLTDDPPKDGEPVQ